MLIKSCPNCYSNICNKPNQVTDAENEPYQDQYVLLIIQKYSNALLIEKIYIL